MVGCICFVGELPLSLGTLVSDESQPKAVQ